MHAGVHPRAEPVVAVREEWLAVVLLDEARVVVHVVVRRVVGEQVVDGVHWEAVPAVVQHRLHRREREEQRELAAAEPGVEVAEEAAERVEQQGLHRVVVQGAVRVGDPQPAVVGGGGAHTVTKIQWNIEDMRFRSELPLYFY